MGDARQSVIITTASSSETSRKQWRNGAAAPLPPETSRPLTCSDQLGVESTRRAFVIGVVVLFHGASHVVACRFAHVVHSVDRPSHVVLLQSETFLKSLQLFRTRPEARPRKGFPHRACLDLKTGPLGAVVPRCPPRRTFRHRSRAGVPGLHDNHPNHLQFVRFSTEVAPN